MTINVTQVAAVYAEIHKEDDGTLEEHLARAWANGYERGEAAGRDQILQAAPPPEAEP